MRIGLHPVAEVFTQMDAFCDLPPIRVQAQAGCAGTLREALRCGQTGAGMTAFRER